MKKVSQTVSKAIPALAKHSLLLTLVTSRQCNAILKVLHYKDLLSLFLLLLLLFFIDYFHAPLMSAAVIEQAEQRP